MSKLIAVDPISGIEGHLRMRTIHSFDPCIACALYVSDPETVERIEVMTDTGVP